MATQLQHKTGFMDLPVEIRLEIYDLLLHIPAFDKFARLNDPSTIVHPNLLLANRQINAEATDFLYSDNMFLAHPTLLASFPRLRNCYGPVKESAVVPRIRRFHLQVRLDCDLPYEQDTVTKAFSGLDELEIDLVQSMYLGVGHRNLRKFEGVRGVRRVRISGSTTGFEEYIQWLEGVMMSEVGSQPCEFKDSKEGWTARLAGIHF
ncbi:hypothetical protein BGZ63DRAFT_424110 [Mariannaea sp. PMI_226]|nr:hypothetical protein BGZ63DRAFT_424110 [Mariannaea sp. PMI_226]